MHEKLEAYLEELGHFLSGREEREEILSEIRSHILEKSAQEYGGVTDAAVDKAIAAYGPARKVALRYVEGQEIIAPIYRRHLFRYTCLLFSVHFLLTLAAVIFKQSFIVFPILFVPRVGLFDAICYLPTALLFDLGAVTLALHFITQSKKEIRLPWPGFSIDLDEVRAPMKRLWNILGLIPMIGLTVFAAYLYVRYDTIFFVTVNLDKAMPLFTPEAGRYFSLTALAILAIWTLGFLARTLTRSRWVGVVSSGASLVLLGILFRQPYEAPLAIDIAARFVPKIRYAATFLLLFIAVMIAFDMARNLIAMGRKRIAR